jgi:hypothetical protein
MVLVSLAFHPSLVASTVPRSAVSGVGRYIDLKSRCRNVVAEQHRSRFALHTASGPSGHLRRSAEKGSERAARGSKARLNVEARDGRGRSSAGAWSSRL